MGGVKNFLYSALLHKQLAEETRGSQQGRQTFEWSERDIFPRSDREPNAAKMTSGILLVRPKPREGIRIFGNPENFVSKAGKANR